MMTYFTFHLFFNLPALLLLLWLTRKRLCKAHWICIGVVGVIVMLAASPWDNWAVHKGIWGFDWERATAIVIPWRGVDWKLPAEEYAFFLIETVFVSLVALLFLPKPEKRP